MANISMQIAAVAADNTSAAVNIEIIAAEPNVTPVVPSPGAGGRRASVAVAIQIAAADPDAAPSEPAEAPHAPDDGRPEPEADSDDDSSGPPSLVSASPASTPRGVAAPGDPGDADAGAFLVDGDGFVLRGGTRLEALAAALADEPPPQPLVLHGGTEALAAPQPRDEEQQPPPPPPPQPALQATGADAAGAGPAGRVWLMNRDGKKVWYDQNVERWRDRRGRFARGPAATPAR